MLLLFLMFGAYRTILAVIVVIHHLGAVPVIGHYAVHGFFVLSGYLMTRIMHETYGYTLPGQTAFAINRALRLYPSNLIVLMISAAIVVATGRAAEFRSPMFLPENLGEWLQNITMLYPRWFPNTVDPRLSPPTWALTIEIIYYVLICLGISKSKSLTWLWFGCAVAWHIYAPTYGHTYYHLLAGALPFSMGGLLFHYARRPPQGNAWVISSLGGLGVVGLGLMEAGRITFYGNMLFAVLTVYLLIAARGSHDAFVGKFSYHIYLLHWPLGVIFFANDKPGAAVPTIVTLVACFVVSLAISRLVDEPVERLRRRFRGRAARPV